MELSETPLLCNFEIESSEALTYIPLIVRFHLDRCGLRISLAQWQLLPLADRQGLARFPADETPAPEPDFAAVLSAMLRLHAQAEPDRLQLEVSPRWHNRAALPAGLTRIGTLTLTQWASLPVFQRYVLDKLTRKPQAHPMLLPALREFGVVSGAT